MSLDSIQVLKLAYTESSSKSGPRSRAMLSEMVAKNSSSCNVSHALTDSSFRCNLSPDKYAPWLKLQINVSRSKGMLSFARLTAFLKMFHLQCPSSWSAIPRTPKEKAYSNALFCTVSPSVTLVGYSELKANETFQLIPGINSDYLLLAVEWFKKRLSRSLCYIILPCAWAYARLIHVGFLLTRNKFTQLMVLLTPSPRYDKAITKNVKAHVLNKSHQLILKPNHITCSK